MRLKTKPEKISDNKYDGQSLEEALMESPEQGEWVDGPSKGPSQVDVMAALFVISVRGMLAKMFMLRRTDPSSEQWKMLNGDADITARDLGEIAAELNFELEFRVTDNHPHDPDF